MSDAYKNLNDKVGELGTAWQHSLEALIELREAFILLGMDRAVEEIQQIIVRMHEPVKNVREACGQVFEQFIQESWQHSNTILEAALAGIDLGGRNA